MVRVGGRTVGEVARPGLRSAGERGLGVVELGGIGERVPGGGTVLVGDADAQFDPLPKVSTEAGDDRFPQTFDLVLHERGGHRQ